VANVYFIAVESFFFGSFHGVHVGPKEDRVHFSKGREKGHTKQNEGTHSLLN
jgi:hypothetical protein